ncbi:MAG: patatin-like phospholipase family protein [Dokdonia sp.]
MIKYLFIFLLFTSLLQAQGPSATTDVTVGVVLSGGGAKGLAHVGVLKVLEEAGIRIDYIAGTSMGAIVGGLYASGYNADQLQALFSNIDFDNIIQDDLPRNAKTFYEKDDDERYALTLPFDDYKLSFPSALSKGQNSYNMLTRILSHVGDVQDFDQLPIPFFCIATDVEKGEPVILDSGYLPEAISASGALPTLFNPVMIDSRMLIDGGVVDNYPVELLKEKGVDIIIGVDVQDDLRNRTELKTAPEIMLQINNYRTIKAMKDKRALTDIYIKPDISNYTVVSFDDGVQIIEQGSAKAKEQFSELKAIANSQKASPNNTPRVQVPLPRKTDSVRISAVTINGNNRYTRAYVMGKLQMDPPEIMSYQDFNQSINNLAATDNFDRIGHRFIQIPDGTVLQLNLQESPSTQSIRLGVHYDDLFRSAALINFTKKRLLFKNDITSFDFILGDNIRYDFNYYIDKGYYWSVGINSTFNTFEKGVGARFFEQLSPDDFNGVNRVTVDYLDLTNQLFLQTLFLKQFSLDLGIQHKFLDIETETVTANNADENAFIFEKSHLAGAYGQLRYDSLDNRYFPTSGVFFQGNFDLYLFSSDYNNNFSEFSIARARARYVTTPFSKVSFSLEASGGFKIGGSETRALDFLLGGYGNRQINNVIPFYGYDFISFGGEGFVKADFTVDYNFTGKNHFNLSANYANAGNNIFSSDAWLPPPTFSGYAIGYGYESFIGPLEVKYTYSPEIKQSDWFISLGFWF